MNQVTFGKFDFTKYSSKLVVTDRKLAKLYGIAGDNVYLLPRGERAKSFACVKGLCRWFLSKGLCANDTVVAVGGGSVGDTVGFATSIYKRGVNILHVPTTLIAQIDSSIGGKTALDLCGVKNAVGSYHFGDTLIDCDFLNTLDKTQYLSGYGELIKYRMLGAQVQQADDDSEATLQEVIAACVAYKQHLCEIDPYCQNERNKLNFGHTVGHALELYYKIPHGVAVANGIYYETLLAAKLGKCSQEYADKWTGEIAQGFPRIYPLNSKIVSLMLHDKKNAGGKVCFVLPDAFEQVCLTTKEIEELLKCFA